MSETASYAAEIPPKSPPYAFSLQRSRDKSFHLQPLILHMVGRSINNIDFFRVVKADKMFAEFHLVYGVGSPNLTAVIDVLMTVGDVAVND